VTLGLSAKESRNVLAEPIRFIWRSYRVMLLLCLAVALGYSLWPIVIGDASVASGVLTSGWSALVWWVGFVGIGLGVPYILVLRSGAKTISKRWVWVGFGCVLAGGLLLRLVLVLGGQGGL
jgi:formate-dependent nitrite reductase membrane component NrfD